LDHDQIGLTEFLKIIKKPQPCNHDHIQFSLHPCSASPLWAWESALLYPY